MNAQKKRRWIGRLKAALTGAALAALCLRPQAAMAAARGALRLWASGVLPALFPYLVLSRLLAGMTGGVWALPVALLAGSPAGARLLALTETDARRAQWKAALCATASPLYVLGTLDGGARMLAAHWLGAAGSAGLVALIGRAGRAPRRESARPQRSSVVPAFLPEIIADSALTLLSVAGCMTFFSVAAALVEAFLTPSAGLGAVLAAALEMAGGCARIVALGLPSPLREACLCAAVSFGGLSVFMQNAPYLKQAGAKLSMQMGAKLTHAAISFALCLLFYRS